MKVPWITTDEADKLFLAAKQMQIELADLDGADLLPESAALTAAMAKLDAILNAIEAK